MTNQEIPVLDDTKQTANIQVHYQKMIADMVTPVSLYLKLRDQYPNALLLESSDYHSKENSRSFICLDPMANFSLSQGQLLLTDIDGKKIRKTIHSPNEFQTEFNGFLSSFNVNTDKFTTPYNGVFGYSTFDAVQYFETIKFKKDKSGTDIPEVFYSFYRFLIVMDHFKNEMLLIENLPKGEISRLDTLIKNTQTQVNHSFAFERTAEETSNTTGKEFMEMVKKGKYHCQRGDVFQIVLARRFKQQYKGDDFTLYRALRKINPSPYLFYFDFGSFRIFGSSPEAQLIISDNTAQIHPIAGTYRRTGDDETDRQRAIELSEDPKENAEHVMLVDLARNDLSRNTRQVSVKKYKEIQYFSHVIHLVSKVEGKLENQERGTAVFSDTFPAGTLSGAPKYKAMQLIDNYEKERRNYYGGAIGFFNFNGDLNHAIMIRSFLSKDNTLHFQAGAGIVIDSKPENELQEVNNKVAALRKALELAEKL